MSDFSSQRLGDKYSETSSQFNWNSLVKRANRLQDNSLNSSFINQFENLGKYAGTSFEDDYLRALPSERNWILDREFADIQHNLNSLGIGKPGNVPYQHDSDSVSMLSSRGSKSVHQTPSASDHGSYSQTPFGSLPSYGEQSIYLDSSGSSQSDRASTRGRSSSGTSYNSAERTRTAYERDSNPAGQSFSFSPGATYPRSSARDRNPNGASALWTDRGEVSKQTYSANAPTKTVSGLADKPVKGAINNPVPSTHSAVAIGIAATVGAVGRIGATAISGKSAKDVARIQSDTALAQQASRQSFIEGHKKEISILGPQSLKVNQHVGFSTAYQSKYMGFPEGQYEGGTLGHVLGQGVLS